MAYPSLRARRPSMSSSDDVDKLPHAAGPRGGSGVSYSSSSESDSASSSMHKGDEKNPVWMMNSLPKSGGSRGGEGMAPPPAYQKRSKAIYWLAAFALLFFIGFFVVLGLWLSSAVSVSCASTSSALGATDAALANLPEAQNVSGRFTEYDALFSGNDVWANAVNQAEPDLFTEMGEGQSPEFFYIGCSDSRVPLTSIANLLPGKLFASRSVGNLYRAGDLNAQTVLSYAVEHLLVKHILVVGHTACGACAAAIATPTDHEKRASSSYYDTASERITEWIAPIRQVFLSSTNPTVVAFRQQYEGQAIPSPEREEPAYVAVIEENVMNNVRNVAADPVIRKMWATWRLEHAAGNDPAVDNAASDLATTVTSASAGAAATDVVSTRFAKRAEDGATSVELWVHGLIFDVATGDLRDLGYSLGPENLPFSSEDH